MFQSEKIRANSQMIPSETALISAELLTFCESALKNVILLKQRYSSLIISETSIREDMVSVQRKHGCLSTCPRNTLRTRDNLLRYFSGVC